MAFYPTHIEKTEGLLPNDCPDAPLSIDIEHAMNVDWTQLP